VSDCLDRVLSQKRGKLEVGRPKAMPRVSPDAGAKDNASDSAA
jgi:hypothetical protein